MSAANALSAPDRPAAEVTPIRPPRRHRSPNRSTILDAAKQVIVEEGYAAATSRRIAEVAGLKHQLIFYYFASLDELLVEVLRRGAEEHERDLDACFDAERPLRSLWEVIRNPTSNRFLTEYMALANHAPAVRDELLVHATRLRRRTIAVLERHLPAATRDSLPTPVMAVLLAIVARGLALEGWMGLTEGHQETDAMIDALIDGIDRQQRDEKSS